MMTEVTVKVPQEMGKILTETSQALYLEAIKEVVAKRLPSLQERLAGLQTEMKRYEEKYHTSYQEFGEHVPDSIEGHDDWIDWTYLTKVAEELESKIQKFHVLVG